MTFEDLMDGMEQIYDRNYYKFAASYIDGEIYALLSASKINAEQASLAMSKNMELRSQHLRDD